MDGRRRAGSDPGGLTLISACSLEIFSLSAAFSSTISCRAISAANLKSGSKVHSFGSVGEFCSCSHSSQSSSNSSNRMRRPNGPIAATKIVSGAVFIASPADAFRVLWKKGHFWLFHCARLLALLVRSIAFTCRSRSQLSTSSSATKEPRSQNCP